MANALRQCISNNTDHSHLSQLCPIQVNYMLPTEFTAEIAFYVVHLKLTRIFFTKKPLGRQVYIETIHNSVQNSEHSKYDFCSHSEAALNLMSPTDYCNSNRETMLLTICIDVMYLFHHKYFWYCGPIADIA